MLDLNDEFGLTCKMFFDGYDFMTTDFGRIIVHETIREPLKNLTYMEELYSGANDFIEYCKSDNVDYIHKELNEKYGVGEYRLTQCNHIENPWNNKEYILFNKKQIYGLFIKNLPDLEFYVCPAYNEMGEVEDIGFRIKNPELVHKSFKWLFPKGNNIIYGKDYVNKEETCYVVEGFRDYVALRECGYNCIGLGSVYLSNKQKEYISTLKDPIMLLDNDSFGRIQTMEFSKNYNVATLIRTPYKDAWDTYTNDIPIKITKINK